MQPRVYTIGWPLTSRGAAAAAEGLGGSQGPRGSQGAIAGASAGASVGASAGAAVPTPYGARSGSEDPPTRLVPQYRLECIVRRRYGLEGVCTAEAEPVMSLAR